VECAVAPIAAGGIAAIHVDCTAENAGFYERCGLQTGLEGIGDLATSAEPK
jgi:hypothetical protein